MTIAGVHARELDVLEHAADDARLPVGEAVHVELDGVLEELVDQHGLARHDLEDLPHDGAQVRLVVDDEHPAASQDERGPEQHGVAHLEREGLGLALAERRAVGRLAQRQPVQHRGEEPPVLGRLDRLGRRADDVDPVRLERRREVERGLAPELDDRPLAALLLVDLEHVLERERLEVEPVARVVVG
jgi:hypothetical protein